MSKAKSPKNGSIKKQSKTVEKPSFFRRNIYAVLIFTVSFLVFANGISNDYNLDDELVTQNHRLTSQGISAIKQIFTEPYYKDNMGYSYEYRPMVLLSFALEHEFFGENPHLSHFFSVLFYAFLCVLLYVVLRKLLVAENPLIAFFVTLLFAVHPTHTEIVDSIKNRDELFALGGALLSLYFALKYTESKKWQYLFAVFAAFLFALLSKLTITSFVVFIPLALVLFRNATLREIWLTTFVLLIPLVVLININTVFGRVVFVSGVFAVNSLLYFLKQCSFEKKTFLIWFSRLKENFGSYAPQFSNKGFSDSISQLLTGIILLLLSVSAVSAYMYNITAVKICLLFAAVVWLFLNWEWKVVMTVLIVIVLAVYHYLYPFYSIILIALIALPLFIVGIRSLGVQRILLTVTAVVVSGYSLLTADVSYSHIIAIVIVSALFFIPQHEKLRWLMLSFAVMALLFGGYTFFKGKVSFTFYLFPVLLLGFYSLQREQRSKYILFFSILAASLFVAGNITPDSARLHHDNSFADIVRYADAPNIMPTTNRPMTKVEVIINDQTPLDEKLGTSMDIAAKYLKLTLIPYPLSYYYGYKYIDIISFWHIYPIAVFLLYVLIGLAALWFFRKKPVITFGILIYLLSVISVLPVFTTLPGMMADRYLFIPSLGFVLLLVYGVFEGTKALQSKKTGELPFKLKTVFAVIFLVYSGITVARNKDWKDRITLFSNDINHVENSAQANNLLAVHLNVKSNSAVGAEQQKLRKEAAKHFERALAIYPDFMNPSFDLGRTYMALGEYDKAVSSFKNTIRIKPTFSESYMAVAKLLEAQGKTQEAVPYYEKTIAINPRRAAAYANLSAIYFRENELQKALEVNQKAISALPGNHLSYVNVGKIFMRMNNLDSAFIYFEKAFQLYGNDYQIASTLYLLSQQRKDEKNMNLYLNKLQSMQPPAINNGGSPPNPMPAINGKR